MATSLNGVVNIWNVNTGTKETMIAEHPGFMIGLAFHPQGNSIASASADSIGRLWDINDGYIQTSIDEPETFLGVGGVAFSPDGSLVAFSDYWKFFLWDTAQNRAGIAPTEGHIGRINTLVFSPDGTQLASGGDDDDVRLWDVSTGQETAVLEGHTDPVYSVAYSPDGTHLASSGDTTVRIWDLETLQPLWVIEGHSAVYSPDGSILAAASEDGTVRLWDPENGQELAILSQENGTVLGIAFNPDGTLLAAFGSSGLVLWNVEEQSQIVAIENTWEYLGATVGFSSVAFSSDGRQLAVGDMRGAIWILAVFSD